MEPFNASPQALLHSKGLLADENNTHHYRTLWTTLNRCLPFKLLGICRRLAGEHINPEERENYLVVEEDLGVAMRERKRPPSCLDSGVLCIPTTLMWRSSIIAPLIPLDFCRFLAEEKGSLCPLDDFLSENGLDPLQMQGLREPAYSFEARLEPDPGQ